MLKINQTIYEKSKQTKVNQINSIWFGLIWFSIFTRLCVLFFLIYLFFVIAPKTTQKEFQNSIQSDIFACIKNEGRYEIRKGTRRKDVIYCSNILLRN